MAERYGRFFLMAGVACSLVGLCFGFAVTYLLPAKYESQGLIEVMPQSSLTAVGIHAAPVPTADFSRTQAELMMSSVIIGKVVEREELAARWNVDVGSAADEVRRSISVENIPGTFLIEISARRYAGDEAQLLAVAVIECYKDYHSAQLKASRNGFLKELKKATREQEDKVEERQRIFDNISQAKGETITISSRPQMLVESHIEPPSLAEAKRDLKAEKQILAGMIMIVIMEDVNMATEDQSVVIHSEPSMPVESVSPILVLNLIKGAAVGLIISPLLASLAILYHRRSARLSQAGRLTVLDAV